MLFLQYPVQGVVSQFLVGISMLAMACTMNLVCAAPTVSKFYQPVHAFWILAVQLRTAKLAINNLVLQQYASLLLSFFFTI